VKLDLHYVDPRLVALYDRDNPRRADTEFYLGLASRLEAKRIVDLGCGTGLLTRALALPGRHVIGVDPAGEMLAWARRQPGAERVEWIEGDAAAIGAREADLTVMTGNVAQVFLDDSEWARVLGHLRAALRPGGTLAFESRNPDKREWEAWNRETTFEVVDTPAGPMETWLEVVGASGGLVHFVGHNLFLDTGEHLVVDSTLRFRSLSELSESLSRAGFDIQAVHGDWRHGPVTPDSNVLLFVARCSACRI